MSSASSVPEGIPYAIPADPAAEGDDALEVSYDNYIDKVNDPIAQDIARGYAPGTSPEALTVRARKGEYTGSDQVEYPEGAPAFVASNQEFQTAEEKIAEADAGHDADRDPAEAAEAAADPSQPSSDAQALTEGDQPGGQFDPNEHTVAEVNDYLADANDAERERVLAAEQDGQARKTLVGE